MTTQTLVTCNGKINQHGFCDKCYQPAHTTSNQCGRLVPYQQAEINTVLAVSGLPGLYKIRNHFVTTLPTGEVTAWDMICWAKDFTRYMDEIIHEAEKAACASGAVDTVAEGGTCPYANHDLHLKLFGYCNACETQIARKSSEGQP